MAGLPRVMAALQEARFDDAALRKLSHEDWLRVLGATWKQSDACAPNTYELRGRNPILVRAVYSKASSSSGFSTSRASHA